MVSKNFGNLNALTEKLWFTMYFQMNSKKKFCKPYGFQIFPIVNYFINLKYKLIR